MIRYFASIGTGKIVLWCYLIWYLVNATALFDPSPSIWLNSAGISLVIGVALMLSVARGGQTSSDPWQTFRLFLMPFCVSSFATLIKGRGYVLVFPTDPVVLTRAVSACAGFVAACAVLRLTTGASRREA